VAREIYAERCARFARPISSKRYAQTAAREIIFDFSPDSSPSPLSLSLSFSLSGALKRISYLNRTVSRSVESEAHSMA